MSREQNKQAETDSLTIRWYDWPSLVFLILLISVVFLQFLTRYVFGSSWSWTEEVSRYLLILCSFGGGISIAARGEFICIDMLQARLNTVSKQLGTVAGVLISLLFMVCFAVGAMELSLTSEQTLISVPIPKGVVFSLIAIFQVVTVVFFCKKKVSDYRENVDMKVGGTS